CQPNRSSFRRSCSTCCLESEERGVNSDEGSRTGNASGSSHRCTVDFGLLFTSWFSWRDGIGEYQRVCANGSTVALRWCSGPTGLGISSAIPWKEAMSKAQCAQCRSILGGGCHRSGDRSLSANDSELGCWLTT